MNIVGVSEEEGFEFLAVNLNLKKDPQFVALKNKYLHFIIVRAVVRYPDNPATMMRNCYQSNARSRH
jgi:hypothetical protein